MAALHANRPDSATDELGELRLQTIHKSRLQAEPFVKGTGQRLRHDLGIVTQYIGIVTLPEIENGMAVLIL